MIRVRYGVMRPGVTGRPKPSREAEQQYEADLALANRRAELLDAAREAEARFREAQARHAPDAEVRGPAEAFDAALTAAMRAAYAAQRAEIGPRGYDDRIYRRKAKATPRVRALTAEAEHLLTLRETHRLTGIPAVAYEPAPRRCNFRLLMWHASRRRRRGDRADCSHRRSTRRLNNRHTRTGNDVTSSRIEPGRCPHRAGWRLARRNPVGPACHSRIRAPADGPPGHGPRPSDGAVVRPPRCGYQPRSNGQASNPARSSSCPPIRLGPARGPRTM